MKNRKIVISAIAIIFIFLIILVWLVSKDIKINADNNGQGVLETVKSYEGRIDTIEKEEYEFFYNIVSRTQKEDTTQKALEEETKKLIADVHAQYLIGSLLGISDTFSYEGLKRNLQVENENRKVKNANGEVIYGKEQFKLDEYYDYTINNLKTDIIQYLTEHADKQLLKETKEYYQENEEMFRNLESIVYETDENGQMTEKVIQYAELSTLEKTDSSLFEYLYQGKEGSEFQYEKDGKTIHGKIKNKIYQELSFEEQSAQVLESYIANEVYGKLVDQIAGQNPVEFSE